MHMAAATTPVDPVAGPLNEVSKLQKVVAGLRTSQIWSQETRSHIKAVAFAWFKSHRGGLSAPAQSKALAALDTDYRGLLSSAEGAPSTKATRARLKSIRTALISLRSQLLIAPVPDAHTQDSLPSFAGLVPDPFMQQVLAARWRECLACLSAGAPLAATVMMGGLLESLLLARVNKETNKQPVFQAKAAPKDRNQTPLPLKDWTLRHYIDVAHELKWISQSAHDVGDVLRDYRNYIHPYKQITSQASLTIADASLFWEVCKSISRQLS